MSEENQELAVKPKQQVGELKDPQREMEFAQKACQVLMEKVKTKKNPVMIHGQQYLEYGDWQTIGRFFALTVGSEDTEEINRDGKLVGYLAKAYVYNREGVKVSSAEAACMRDEKNWGDKPEFQLRSMAQTRASAKALRNAVGWVAELAGYSSTPAEEMQTEPFKGDEFNQKKQVQASPDKPATEKQIKLIKDLAEKKGKKLTGDLTKLNSKQASTLIKNIMEGQANE